MKCEIINITLILAALVGMSIDARMTAECYCGYGGLCFKDPRNNPVEFECSKVCPKVSGGFYSTDCLTIKNHCVPSPCVRGECIRTFGSYYCKCPKDYFGKKCDYHKPLLTSLGLTNEVYIYYQVQPYKDGDNNMYIVYDPQDDSVESGVEILVTVEFNGRVEYPARGEQFVLYNIKEKCLADTKLNPGLYDPHVCEYLPAGKVWTFTFRSTSYVSSYSDPDNIISLPEIGKIGRSGSIHLQIEVSDGRGMHRVLFEETYSVFTYSFHARIPNNCRIDMVFKGCSTNKRYPFLYSLGDFIRIVDIANIVECKGILVLGHEWFLQKNINRSKLYPFDRVPKRIYEADGSKFLSFRARYFKPGLHSIQYVLNLRGKPPWAGGTKHFTAFSRCWINVLPNIPHFEIEGGNKRTVNCYQSLRMKVILLDNNYELSDFTFSSRCKSVTEDEECKHRHLEGPYLNKYFTPCNTEYNYTILAMHRDDITPPVEFAVNIFFVETETELFVECIYNCYPIDPEFIVLIGAWTIPYAPLPVMWNVTVQGEPLDPRHILTTGFQSSSRILHVDGAVFVKGLTGLQSVDVEFRASKEYNNLNGSLSSKVDILKSDLSKFNLVLSLHADESVYTFINDSEVHFLFNNPMTFAVYSIHEKMREVILEMQTNYIDRIQFTPQLDKVILCLKDSLQTKYVQKCTKGSFIRKWKTPEVDLAQLDRESRMKDTVTFFKHTQGYLIKNLGGLSSSTLQWHISLEERIKILHFMTRFEILYQFDIMSSVSILSMLFYSVDGCNDQELLPFEPDVNALNDFHAASDWLKVNHLTIGVLKRTLIYFHQRVSRSSVKILDYTFGDVLDKVLSTWTLAYLQDTFMVDNAFAKKDPTIRDLYISAEIDFWRTNNYNELKTIGVMYVGIMVQVQQPFYGLRYVGKGSVRAWVMRCPYSCIMTYLNKSNPAKDKFRKHVNYVFGTPTPERGWISFFNLTLPSNIPGWEYETLYFAVVIIRNRRNDRKEVAPLVVIQISMASGTTIKELPSDNGYRITLPTMVNGELSNSSHQFVKDKFEIVKRASRSQQFDYRSLSVYKLTLPMNARKFVFYIYNEKPISFKAQISYQNAPDYDDVANTVDKVGVYDENMELYAFTVSAKPLAGQKWVQRPIYLGLLPSNATPLGVHRFWGQETITFCEITEVIGALWLVHSCVSELPGKYENSESVSWDEIRCYCLNFGVLSAKKLPLNTAKLMVDPIYFVTPEQYNVPGIVLCSLLLLIIVIALIIAIFLDHKRGKEHTLVYVDDAYPMEAFYSLVVGVFTGMNPLAGTCSSVAIKVIGSNASSRVHILKCRSRRGFVSGNDDWFVIPISQPMGKITAVSLWLDFKRLSDWYCTRIMIYEVKSYRWYYVNVERWMKMYPTNEETKMLSLSVTEIEQFEDDTYTFNYTFATYYFRELRSTHLPFSLFYLHYRSTSTYEQKYLLYIVKIVGVILWTWVMLEFLLKYIFPKFDKDNQFLTRVTLETSKMGLLIALLSRIFTVPLQMLDRFKVISRLLQRRTTQPLLSTKDSSRGHGSESRSSNPTSISSQRLDRTQSRASQRPEQRDSRYSRTERIRSTQRYSRYSSADFRRKSSRGPSLHEFSWRKAGLAGGRSTLVSLTFAPHQFRSVNVSQTVFKQKTRRNLLITRIVFGLLLIGFMAFFIYLEFFTGYWKKTEITCFLVAFTLFYDAFFVDPCLTFVKSFIAFVFLDLSNKEVNIWNEEARHEIKLPLTLNFQEYVKKATGREYKPLLSTELDKKRKYYGYHKTLVLSLYYAAMLIAFFACYTMLQFYDTKSKWAAVRTTETSFSDPVSEFGHKGVKITDVVNPQKVEEFVTTNLADADITWNNGEYIGPNRRRWGKDHTSTPLEATNVILLLISDEKSYQSVPLELDEYLSSAYPVFSKQQQLTQPIMIGFEVIKYNVTYSGSIFGRSRGEYPFAGHTFHFASHPWKRYYVNVRYAMDKILRHPALIIRAMIFTTNYFNRNKPSFTTVDVVVEFLSSGLSTAVTRVHTSVALSPYFSQSQILSTIMTFIGVVTCILNIYLICKPIDYFGKWQTFRMCLFFLSCFINAAFSAFVRHKKNMILKEVSLEYSSKFTDIHQIYAIDLWGQCIMATIIFVITVEAAVLIYRLVGSGRITVIATSSIHIVLAMYVLTIYLLRIYELCHYNNEPRLLPVTFSLYLKQLIPLLPENRIYAINIFTIYLAIFFVQLLMKFYTACAVFSSRQLDEDRPSVINKILLGLLRRRGGGSFAALCIRDGFGNGFSRKSNSNLRTNGNFQSNTDKEKQPIHLLSSHIDGKILWLINK